MDMRALGWEGLASSEATQLSSDSAPPPTGRPPSLKGLVNEGEDLCTAGLSNL